MCTHRPMCPTADSSHRHDAAVVSTHPEQGWSLLCNGTIVFDDTGELLPDGRVIAPRRTRATEHVVVGVRRPARLRADLSAVA